jgi:hypothetical protein
MRALHIVFAAVVSLDTDREEQKREKIKERFYNMSQSAVYERQRMTKKEKKP